MPTPHPYADILHAIADGKEVEWARKRDKVWFPFAHPDTYPGVLPDILWRIKPEKKTVWLNIYKGTDLVAYHTSKAAADAAAGEARVACVQVTYEEGEGLN